MLSTNKDHVHNSITDGIIIEININVSLQHLSSLFHHPSFGLGVTGAVDPCMMDGADGPAGPTAPIYCNEDCEAGEGGHSRAAFQPSHWQHLDPALTTRSLTTFN